MGAAVPAVHAADGGADRPSKKKKKGRWPAVATKEEHGALHIALPLLLLQSTAKKALNATE